MSSSAPATPSTPATAAPAPKESLFEKLWGWIKKETTNVEEGIEDIFGSNAAQAIESAGKELLSSNFGPVIAASIADATDAVTGQMSVSKALDNIVSGFEAAGKSVTKAAALQILGVAQNALPVGTGTASTTVTPVA
jgi:hypothetical protein